MYKILVDYGSEGFKFIGGEYQTVNFAVKEALVYSSAFPFLIVQVVEWEAINK